MLWVVPLVLAAVGLASPSNCEALQGCQGPPPKPTVLAKPTLVFVWPCFAHADTFKRFASAFAMSSALGPSGVGGSGNSSRDFR